MKHPALLILSAAAAVLAGCSRDDGIDWPQIMSDRDTNDITGRYGISYFPTTYLIGPDGVIIEKDIRGQAIVDKVLSLVGKNAG